MQRRSTNLYFKSHSVTHSDNSWQHRCTILQTKLPSQMLTLINMPPHSKVRIPQFLIIPRHKPLLAISSSSFTSTQRSCWRNREFQQPTKFSPKQTSTHFYLCISVSVYHFRHYSSTHYHQAEPKLFLLKAQLLSQSSFFHKLSSPFPLPLINAAPLLTIICAASFLYLISHTPRDRPPHALHVVVMEIFPQQK